MAQLDGGRLAKIRTVHFAAVFVAQAVSNFVNAVGVPASPGTSNSRSIQDYYSQ
jgi:hypothetical protein